MTTTPTQGAKLTLRAQRLFERASAKAGDLGIEATGVEHLLFAMLDDQDSVAFHVLSGLVDVEAVRAELTTIFESEAYRTGSSRRVMRTSDGSLVPVEDGGPFADD